MTRFTEVADRVWVAHYDWMHVNITLVGGDAGLLMVDTHGSERTARTVADDVRRLGAGPLSGIINTHEHWDHTFGNVVMLEEFGAMPVHAHDWAAEHTLESGERAKEQFREQPDDPHAEEVLETRVVAADQTLSSVRILDLGDRQVELIHPGRGHTAGDLVVRVPDADVLAAGDLVEQSDPPFIGGDSWPFEWPTTMDLVLGFLGDATVVVPGHGKLVDKEFVQEQRSELGVIARTIGDLAGSGVPVEAALATGEWPWPTASLEHAVRVGYEQLPRSQKRLPLI
jgi:glyoxylase-like metal-dependent hydrolase (beta-lactamase superfamily II)